MKAKSSPYFLIRAEIPSFETKKNPNLINLIGIRIFYFKTVNSIFESL